MIDIIAKCQVFYKKCQDLASEVDFFSSNVPTNVVHPNSESVYDLDKFTSDIEIKTPQENNTLKHFQENAISSVSELDIKEFCLNNNIDYYQLKFLGEGVFKKAYLYENEVVLFTKSKKDVEALVKLNDLKSSLPKEFQGYIMNIYNIVYDKELNLFAMFVESLEELNPYIKSSLYGRNLIPTESKKYITQPAYQNIKSIITHSFISSLVKKIVDNYYQYIKNDLDEVNVSKNQLADSLIAVLLNNNWDKVIGEIKNSYPKANPDDYEKILSDLGKYILQTIEKPFQKMGLNLDYYENENALIYNNLCADIKEDIINQVETQLPTTYDNNYDNVLRTDRLKQLPHLTNFIRFLEYLVAKGIKWRDLHMFNVMQRPSTKDPVISDPGLFTFK